MFLDREVGKTRLFTRVGEHFSKKYTENEMPTDICETDESCRRLCPETTAIPNIDSSVTL
jgi:hypothetical protein